MQVITIVQTKGGSGKTTTAMLLASAALNLGRRVTLIDGDVNAQLDRWRDSFELAAWEGAQKPEWPEKSRDPFASRERGGASVAPRS